MKGNADRLLVAALLLAGSPSANHGIGTIGIINLAGEETRWENLQVWANLPLVITWTDSFARTNGDMSGQIGCGVTSSVGSTMATNASNTVFMLSGLGRLIAYDDPRLRVQDGRRVQHDDVRGRADPAQHHRQQLRLRRRQESPGG
jgi:hypothetical protein